MGSLNVCSGESSTRTLFLRVMETFDDDDDDDYTTLGLIWETTRENTRTHQNATWFWKQ